MDRFNKYPFQGIIPGSILPDRSIMGKREMNGRRSHGFIIKLRGSTEYRSPEGRWLLETGQILFVEKGSSYFIREVDPGYSYVVNFESDARFPHPIYKLPFPAGFDISPLAEKMYRCWQKEDAYGALAALYQLLSKTVHTGSYSSGREKQLLEPVVSYLTAHLTDPDMSLEPLSDLAGVSDTYLRRIFKKQYGTGPAGFVIRKRIALARQLLVSGEGYSVADVAALTGFKDPLYFSRCFKKQLGLSPTAYCKAHAEDLF